MKVWAFVSQKGGSGRSTLCTQEAAYGCQIGERVVIIDLDVQGSASAWHEARGMGESPGVVKCVPSKLVKLVEAIREHNLATIVMIDTPPHTDETSVAAIQAADLVICPLRYGLFDEKSLTDTIALIELSKSKGRAIGVVNAIRTGRAAIKDYQQVASRIERYGIRVAAQYICDRRVYVEAIAKGKGVTERHAKRPDEATKEIQALWAELNETPEIALTPEAAAND